MYWIPALKECGVTPSILDQQKYHTLKADVARRHSRCEPPTPPSAPPTQRSEPPTTTRDSAGAAGTAAPRARHGLAQSSRLVYRRFSAKDAAAPLAAPPPVPLPSPLARRDPHGYERLPDEPSIEDELGAPAARHAAPPAPPSPPAGAAPAAHADGQGMSARSYWAQYECAAQARRRERGGGAGAGGLDA